MILIIHIWSLHSGTVLVLEPSLVLAYTPRIAYVRVPNSWYSVLTVLRFLPRFIHLR